MIQKKLSLKIAPRVAVAIESSFPENQSIAKENVFLKFILCILMSINEISNIYIK